MKSAALRSWARFNGWTDFLGGYRMPKPPRAMPHPIPEGPNGVIDMIESAQNDNQKALAVLCGLMGLRVSEARSIKWSDFCEEEMSITIVGKGDRWRTIPMSELAWKYLFNSYSEAVSESRVSGLVVNYSDRGARKAVTEMAKRAGLTRHVASHDLRGTFGTAAYSVTKDLRAVQELLGHASAKTTEVYTGIDMAAMRKAVNIA